MRKGALIGTALAVAVTLAWVPASAQKSKDTLRFAVTEALKGLSPYFFPHREGGFMYNNVYESLLAYDERKKEFLPLLVKSWKQIDPKTFEFVVRDDIKFHNGSEFNADDVVYLFDWLTQEKKLYAPRSYSWIKGAEKIGPDTVRVHSKRADPTIPLRLATNIKVIDSELHKSLKNKDLYGRHAMGTGPYKVVSITDDAGAKFVRNDAYAEGPGRPVARIKHLEGVFIPDPETQVASLLTGNVEAVRDPAEDKLAFLEKNPNLAVTGLNSLSLTYIQLDAANRSGIDVLKDRRVRRAVFMAIDRGALKPFVPGGKFARPLSSMCFRAMIGCDFDVVPPAAYDPEGAKKLLAEAGYPNGFDITINSLTVTRELGIAISGMLRKVGINARVDNLTAVTMRKMRNQGKLQALVNERPYEPLPDASYVLNRFFTSKRRAYAYDDRIDELEKLGFAATDLAAREKIYKEVMDRINTEAYVLPLASLPLVWVHSKDVRFYPNVLTTYDTTMADFGWK